MKKKEALLVILVSIITFFVTFFSIKKVKRSLILSRLIGKDTKILNIYTENYVENNLFANVKEKKSGIETFVYTDRAKKVYDIDIFDEHIPDEYEENVKEIKQVETFINEFMKVTKGATAVIHVGTESKARTFSSFTPIHKNNNCVKVIVTSDKFVDK